VGHNITAIIVKGEIQTAALKEWDLILEELPFDIKLAYIDSSYSACWQSLKKLEGYLPAATELPLWFPRELVILDIARALTGSQEPSFSIIQTDYFGGAGEQYAQLYRGSENISTDLFSINDALSYFGVKRSDKIDEFDSIGLGKFRSNPDYLEKYQDMAEELDI